MIKFYPLFSSSSGNCTYIGDESSGILIDVGVSCKRICSALADNNIPVEAVKGIFITHTHSDHISGLKVFSKKVRTPVFSLETNLNIIANNDKVFPECELVEVKSGKAAEISGYEVTPFKTPHDSPASCGYRIVTPNGRTCAVCTDLGKVTPAIERQLLLCDLVLLESNYDEQMLWNGSYPYELKERIASGHGHLSNDSCAEELQTLIKAGVCRFVLGHLSPNNNTPELAEKSAVSALSEYKRGEDYLLDTARPEGGRAVLF